LKRVLMNAFQFPPFAGSSAIQRTLRFVQHLPSFGWEPIVLTATPSAYESTSTDLLGSIPGGTVVKRAFAFDAVRRLSIARRYPSFIARPDRWSNWRFSAVRAGISLIDRYRPAVLWSTYPIATAHVIGSRLHRKSGLPWIADFRDPMAQEGYPPDPRTWKSYRAIEADAVRRAAFTVFTTPGAASMYRDRYPDVGEQRLRVIENGYDEASFASLGQHDKGPLIGGRVTLLHSGVIYASERDPSRFFEALGRLKRRGCLRADRVSIRFRASGNDELLRTLARQHGIEDLIELLPSLPYRQALEEMVRADGLLVLQASNCNQQIPAKLYEYLRAGRPMLGLTDPAGDTAATMRRAGAQNIAPLDDAGEIEVAVSKWIDDIAAGCASRPDRGCAEAN